MCHFIICTGTDSRAETITDSSLNDTIFGISENTTPSTSEKITPQLLSIRGTQIKSMGSYTTSILTSTITLVAVLPFTFITVVIASIFIADCILLAYRRRSNVISGIVDEASDNEETGNISVIIERELKEPGEENS